MPSSTFNSDSATRAPELHWNCVWVGVCVVLLILGISLETFGRANGYRTSINDDLPLWTYHRQQVSEQKSQVVLLGASRIQFGFSTKVFHDRFPVAPIAVLAINNTSPIATLHDLAEDDCFHGTVICSTTAFFLSSRNWEGQRKHVAHFHESDSNKRLELFLKTRVQNQFVVANRNNFFRIVEQLQDARFSGETYAHTTMNFDRSCLADFSLISRKKLQSLRNALLPSLTFYQSSVESWVSDLATVKSLVGKIEARGGQVAFVRFPSTGKYWEIDEQQYPKRAYWDQLQRLTGAETIHFRDVPTLANFDCPDMSHLDYRDASKFTAALLDELVKRGVLPDNNE